MDHRKFAESLNICLENWRKQMSILEPGYVVGSKEFDVFLGGFISGFSIGKPDDFNEPFIKAVVKELSEMSFVKSIGDNGIKKWENFTIVSLSDEKK